MIFLSTRCRGTHLSAAQSFGMSLENPQPGITATTGCQSHTAYTTTTTARPIPASSLWWLSVLGAGPSWCCPSIMCVKQNKTSEMINYSFWLRRKLSFLLQTGRMDPQHPRVCGHRGRVLDVKWNPFDDHCIASCSEDCTVRILDFWTSSLYCSHVEKMFSCTQVKIWDIPICGVQQNLTKARKTLIGHSRRVGLIEWHPTAENLLLSAAYDYKVRHHTHHWHFISSSLQHSGYLWCLRIAIMLVKSFVSTCHPPRFSSGMCPRVAQCSGTQCGWSWSQSITATHLRCCCYLLALTVMAAGWLSHLRTDGSESWTPGQERSSRCVFIFSGLCAVINHLE